MGLGADLEERASGRPTRASGPGSRCTRCWSRPGASRGAVPRRPPRPRDLRGDGTEEVGVGRRTAGRSTTRMRWPSGQVSRRPQVDGDQVVGGEGGRRRPRAHREDEGRSRHLPRGRARGRAPRPAAGARSPPRSIAPSATARMAPVLPRLGSTWTRNGGVPCLRLGSQPGHGRDRAAGAGDAHRFLGAAAGAASARQAPSEGRSGRANGMRPGGRSRSLARQGGHRRDADQCPRSRSRRRGRSARDASSTCRVSQPQRSRRLSSEISWPIGYSR